MKAEQLRATRDQVDHGIDLGMRIQELRREQGFRDKGGHAKSNKDKVSCLGFIGETVYADIYDLERPQLIEEGLDEGHDFEKGGHTIQVKTTETPYLILFPDNYRNKEPDMYAVIKAEWDGLVDFSNPEMQMVHITRGQVEQQAEVKDFGYGDRVVVDLREVFE